MQKFGIIIQARLNSKRLYGKVLRDFCGTTLLMYKIKLLNQLNINYPVVVATSENPLDDSIIEICLKNNIHYFRGSEENVFVRFQKLLDAYQFENIIRLTADNPLTHVNLLNEGIRQHLKYKPDITTTRKINPDNSIISFVPKGFSFDIISSSKILEINDTLLTDFEKEHVIPIFFRSNYRICYIRSDNIEGNFSIDTEEEFRKMENFVKSFNNFSLLEKFLNRK